MPTRQRLNSKLNTKTNRNKLGLPSHVPQHKRYKCLWKTEKYHWDAETGYAYQKYGFAADLIWYATPLQEAVGPPAAEPIMTTEAFPDALSIGYSSCMIPLAQADWDTRSACRWCKHLRTVRLMLSLQALMQNTEEHASILWTDGIALHDNERVWVVLCFSQAICRRRSSAQVLCATGELF